MRVLIEMPDYARAENLLIETFQASSAAQDDQTARGFYTVAGQLINGARAHIDRYRILLTLDERQILARARLLRQRVSQSLVAPPAR